MYYLVLRNMPIGLFACPGVVKLTQPRWIFDLPASPRSPMSVRYVAYATYWLWRAANACSTLAACANNVGSIDDGHNGQISALVNEEVTLTKG